MRKLFQFYRILNLLSLDVASGAVISALFFARLLGVQVRPSGLFSLGLTVWIIYTADHLYDAWTIKSMASTARHKFHQNNFKPLLVILVLIILVDLGIAFFIKTQVFRWGIGLTAIVCLYFLIQSRLKLLKELIGALLYSSGVLLPSLSVTEKIISSFTILLITQFVITALINLVLFSWFDYSRDLQDSRSSLITILGNRVGQLFLCGLFAIQGCITAFLLLYADAAFAVLVLAMMNLALLFIYWASNFFSVHDRYRLAGDAVFFLPLLYIVR